MTFREADELRERHTAAVHPGVRATQLVPEPALGVEATVAVLRGDWPVIPVLQPITEVPRKPNIPEWEGEK